jgi:PAS domain S-box-containing protein
MNDTYTHAVKGNILIVDDTHHDLRFLTSILSEQGYIVRPVPDGSLALTSVQAELPDVILLDIKLPGISGYEICARLKAEEQTCQIPVIFISALHDVTEKVKGFKLGGVDYITKPFQAEEVLARVETHLALRNLQKRLQAQNLQLHQEIMERKRLEEALRKFSRAVEQSACTIIITDLNGTIEFVNRTFSRQTGYTPQEALGNTPCLLQSGKHTREFYAMLWETIQRGEVWQGEVMNKKKNGELYWEFTSISPIRDPEGTITHYLAVKEDITERKQAEQELTRLNQYLQEANTSKDKFFSIIAHDLRTPFNGLFGVTETVIEYLDDWSKDEIKYVMREWRKSAETVYTLLENLLSWSRLQQGSMEYAPHPLALEHIVDHNVGLFASIARQKQITLRSRLPKNTMVYADHPMLDTVIRNLLSNALKFTHAQGTIEVSASLVGDHVEVAVADTGVGIPVEHLATLFHIDAKHSEVGTAGETGTGLGLILCKELIEKNDGRIWVDSTGSNGTIFRFVLPRGPLPKEKAPDR